jgi:hypothetical protein
MLPDEFLEFERQQKRDADVSIPYFHEPCLLTLHVHIYHVEHICICMYSRVDEYMVIFRCGHHRRLCWVREHLEQTRHRGLLGGARLTWHSDRPIKSPQRILRKFRFVQLLIINVSLTYCRYIFVLNVDIFSYLL